MASNDVLLSLLAAATMASLAGLSLIDRDKESRKSRLKLDAANVDTVVLIAAVTFVAMMIARHPEWVS